MTKRLTLISHTDTLQHYGNKTKKWLLLINSSIIQLRQQYITLGCAYRQWQLLQTSFQPIVSNSRETWSQMFSGHHQCHTPTTIYKQIDVKRGLWSWSKCSVRVYFENWSLHSGTVYLKTCTMWFLKSTFHGTKKVSHIINDSLLYIHAA